MLLALLNAPTDPFLTASIEELKKGQTQNALILYAMGIVLLLLGALLASARAQAKQGRKEAETARGDAGKAWDEVSKARDDTNKVWEKVLALQERQANLTTKHILAMQGLRHEVHELRREQGKGESDAIPEASPA